MSASKLRIAAGLGAAALGAVAAHDLVQRNHAVTRNFPVVGHLRFLLERIGPELRQYIVTDNDSERPFSRDQRRWIYASSKGENSYFGFGTDNDIERADDYVIVKHVAFPIGAPENEPPHADPALALPAAKVLGEARARRHAFRPNSIVNISGMSFGALSGAAIEALNRGAAAAGCWHNTGEGGLSPAHQHGGDLVFQIGTSYFGVRDAAGAFELSRLVDLCGAHPVRAVEIKLSQGAKPGIGGLLPGAKVTPEIARIRGIPVGVDCRSPANHTAFQDVDSLLDLVERIADATGLPVGIKSAVGESRFWADLARRMDRTGVGVDFVSVDGGEGGTGAGPLVFTDHVALPFVWGFPIVYRAFAELGLHESVFFVGSAKLGTPERALLAMSLGCDSVSVGREAMLAIGCIQAQRCHTGQCPTGVATQSPWRQRGLDPTLKSNRLAMYVATLRFELLRLARACGQPHPGLVAPNMLEILRPGYRAVAVDSLFQYEPLWGLPSTADRATMSELLAAVAASGGSAPTVQGDRADHTVRAVPPKSDAITSD